MAEHKTKEEVLEELKKNGPLVVLGTTGHEIDPAGIDHPQHYNLHPAGIECIDVIEHMTHNVGAAIKYLWRAGLKPGEDDDKDLAKAIWYIERERARRGASHDARHTAPPLPAAPLLPWGDTYGDPED